MYLKIKNSKLLKGISVFSALNLMFQIFYPTAAYALTSGPTQPEIASFEPISTNQMVNEFSGDFTYNIPLLTVPGPNGGYPINMSYHSGITMDQEASWVGLGWNINPGVIQRSLRGLPDDFNGAKIKKEYFVEPIYNRSLSGNLGTELFAADKLKGKLGVQLNSNSRTGVGLKFSASMSFEFLKSAHTDASAGIGLDFDTESGVGLTTSYGLGIGPFSVKQSYYNTKYGLQSRTLEYSAKARMNFKGKYAGSTYDEENKKIVDHYKSKTLKFGVNGASTIHYGKDSFTPTSVFPFRAESDSYFVGLGTINLGIFKEFQGMYTNSKTFLDSNEKLFESYGYMYSENSTDESLMDFTRESDGKIPYSLKTLPMPIFTNDVFQAYAQGMMSSFRPYRSDVGILHDPRVESNGNVGHMGGLEIAWGSGFQAGFDYSESYVESHTGKWTGMGTEDPNDTDAFNEKYKFHKKEDLTPNLATSQKDGSLYEPYYMRSTGDKTYDRSYLGDEVPGVFPLTGTKKRPEIGASANVTTRRDRKKRVQSTFIRTLKDLENSPVSSYDILQHHTATDYSELSAAYPNANLEDQIAEITVYNADGMRYVYGLPVYNAVSKNVVFSVDDPKLMSSGAGEGGADGEHPTKKLYDYTPANHVKKGNDRGVDEFFSRNTVPAYAYAHLLTASYSPDYVDLKGDGPTEDDLGYYVKYDYDKVADTYKWRAPFYDANYMEGALTNYADNRATYSYGEKEIYVLKSIETKTHIAHFVTSERNDAFGVTSEHQEDPLSGSETIDGQKKLDRIDLYSKRDADYIANGDSDAQTIAPIKSIHFQYDYSLCKNIDNHISNDPTDTDHGKLTLKKMFMTYGNSRRGALSPYQFTYSDKNPDYAFEGKTNRWGGYQGTQVSSNNDFSYVNQKESYDSERHEDASAWNLAQIKLPSGAEMNVEYEQDDYAYVQNKDAMQMVKVLGIGNASQIKTSNVLNGNHYVYFELNQDPELITGSNLTAQQLGNNMVSGFVNGVNQLYFNTYMKMKQTPDGWEVGSEEDEIVYDYVKGYAEVDKSASYGYRRETINGVDTPVGYFKVKGVNIGDYSNQHPFTKAVIQDIKLSRQDLIVAPEDSDEFFDVSEFDSILSFFEDLIEFIEGYYTFAVNKGYGSKIQISEEYPSFVRLNKEDGIKYGGGHRVSRVTLNDQWGTMTSGDGDNFDYGQEYIYRLPDGKSSGVATYEPVLGNEENPFYQPEYYNGDDFIVNDEAAYRQTPVGEQYYPMPSVGYSRVIVDNIVRDEEKSSSGDRLTAQTGEGILVNEFYTAKDFPVLLARNEIKKRTARKESILDFIGFNSIDNRAFSQGFTIHLNDMDGKPKAQIIYPENTILFQKDQEDPTEAFISPAYSTKTSYIYDTMDEYDPALPYNRLDNKVKTRLSDGTTEQAYLGRTIEFFTDTREDYKQNSKTGTQIDGGYTWLGPVAVPFVGLFIDIEEITETLFRSVVSNKVVSKNGILTKVISNKAGVETTVEHQLFDAETGQALLTRVKNEYGKSIYSYDYPAHQQYTGMAGAYHNIGATYHTTGYNLVSEYDGIDNVLITGYIKENSGDVFFIGDEVEVKDANDRYHSYWVIDKSELYDETLGITEVKVHLASKIGTTILPTPDGTNALDMKVVRSGKRNHLTTSVGAKTYMEGNHILSDLLNEDLPSSVEVIDASSIGTLIHSVKEGRDCDGNNISGFVYMYLEDAHTFSFNFFDGVETTPKAFIEFSQNVDLTTAPYNVLNGCQFIKEDNVMHVQFASNTASPEYVKAKWNDPEDAFLACELILQAAAVEYDAGKWDIPYNELPDQRVDDYTLIVDNNANSYAYGKLGVWRPRKSHTYVTNRVQSADGGAYNTNIAKDGYFEEFTEFDWSVNQQEDGNWRWVSESTKISPYGFELESKNALGQYTSVLYDYDGALPTAIAQNTSYNELAYTGFEDINPEDIHADGGTTEYLVKGHWNLSIGDGIDITSEEAHTGNYSLKYLPSTPGCGLSEAEGGDNYGNGAYFYFNPIENNTGFFNPHEGKEYIVSAWVKAPEVSTDAEELNEIVSMDVQQQTGATWSSFTNLGWVNTYWSEMPMIEGWKKIEVKFLLPSTIDQNYRIRFSGKSCSQTSVYLDDIRICPVDGAMISYVYDRDNLRLTAELDGNNFATFYDYDDAGSLIQVKKETTEGIKTLQNSRSNSYKSNSID